jgi:hypothetical protein
MAVRREQIITTAIAFVEEARVPVDHACDTSSRFHHQHLGRPILSGAPSPSPNAEVVSRSRPRTVRSDAIARVAGRLGEGRGDAVRG